LNDIYLSEFREGVKKHVDKILLVVVNGCIDITGLSKAK